MIYGYARVPIDAQDDHLSNQVASLKAAGCARIFRKRISGCPLIGAQ
jgi:predicted site-specific integrase-resolvase